MAGKSMTKLAVRDKRTWTNVYDTTTQPEKYEVPHFAQFVSYISVLKFDNRYSA